MTKQDFIDWKQHPVTSSFIKAILEKREGLREELGFAAGSNPIEDAVKRGAILTCTDILNMEYSELGDVE
jgi:hypothetical protein